MRTLVDPAPFSALMIALLACCFGLQAVPADEVIMRNGDRLTGKVNRQEKGRLKLGYQW